jgi:hypothetical protein
VKPIDRRIAEERPPPVSEAIADEAAELLALGKRRLVLLRQAAAGEAVLLVVKTGTRTDTGSWFGQRRLYMAFTRTAMLVFATGPRPLCRRIPLAELGDTKYNAVTGELVFAPDKLPVWKVALPPVEAAWALAQIGKG